MPHRLWLLVILAVVAPFAACEDGTVAPPVGPRLRIEGTITEPRPDVVVPGAYVLVGVSTPEGLGAWASDSTDAGGQYAIELDAPVACAPEDSLSAILQVEAEDFEAYTHGSLQGRLRLACDTETQKLDATIHRQAYRSPQPTEGARSPTSLALGTSHACAVAEGGTWCWGLAGAHLGNVVYGAAQAWAPVRVLGGHKFTTVSAGKDHTCALETDGRAWCWGDGRSGELGPGTDGTSVEPLLVSADLHFVDVVAGRQHSCGLTSDGDVWCWGATRSTRAGIPAAVSDVHPEPVRAALDLPAAAISAAFAHTCALMADGQARCWGYSYAGELGAGEAQGDHFTPMEVTGGHTWTKVDAGEVYSCALDVDGLAWCWGRDAWGRFGAGAIQGDVGTPVAVGGGHAFVDIDAGGTHACALTSDGVAWCWGRNDEGQLGVAHDAFDPEAPLPVRVDADLRFTSLRAGNRFTCGVTAERNLVCWGWAAYLGAGYAISG